MPEERQTLYPEKLLRLRRLAGGVFQRYSLPRWLVFLFDLVIVIVTFHLAYLLRFNFEPRAYAFATALEQGLLAAGVYLLFSLVFKPWSGLIRHTTILDTLRIFLSATSTLAVLMALALLDRRMGWRSLLNIPLSILLIHYLLVSLFLAFSRVFIKLTYEYLSLTSKKHRNVLIFGAGSMGVIAKRVIMSDPASIYRIKGFLDDDRKLQGKLINGIRVYSPRVLKRAFIESHDIHALIIAIRLVSPGRKGDVIASALELGLEVLEVPPVDNWLNGNLHVRQLRQVRVEDLLGRDPIALDTKKIGEGLAGKTVLVTGAAGSIGSEIVRQLARFSPARILLLDQAETPVFFLTRELEKKLPHAPVEVIIGDVTHRERMEQVFERYRPGIVFHAAAYKHVPLMESQPHEALRVNLGGTMVTAELAVKYRTEKFVLISSDKAVNPTNVMGASKRLCELAVQAYARGEDTATRFITTRFGNVLASSGSVIPLFENQIREGGPLTITHPDISRFFMTIPEACQLVLEAGCMGRGGEIYVFDMGKAIRIIDLARHMIRLSGFIPSQDIKIEYTGLRPGEKLFEELFAEGERKKPTHHPKIMIATNGGWGNGDILEKVRELLYNAYGRSESELIGEMKELIPEYVGNR